MANSEKVRKLIADWHAAQSADKVTEVGREPVRGYDARYGRHDIERERAAEEARSAASLAREFMGERTSR